MTLVQRQIYLIGTSLALVLTISMVTTAASASSVHDLRFANGVEARVYTADYLKAATETVNDTRGLIALDDGSYLTVVTSVEDPLIANKGDGSFHPFRLEHVVEFINDITYKRTNVDVEIYILPYPRSNVLVSSASGNKIFLSPQVLEVSRASAAYIVAHEFGHVFQNRYLPDRARRLWSEYRQLRGIEDTGRYSPNAAHANRPDEIFAEDFRVLFGGPTAYYGGHIENTHLTRPEHVPGLRAFFEKLNAADYDVPFIVGVGNHPNPFNPVTELRVELAADFVATGEAVKVTVYDVRGARVRELFNGAPSSQQLRVTWDGRDHHGREVASQTYFAVVEAGNSRMTRKMLMIK